MAEVKARPSLDDNSVQMVISCLVDDPRLRLPGSLTQTNSGKDVDSKSERSDYLSALLLRDPGVFLERHGDLLPASELQLFESLRSDYEVDFYFRQLQQQLEPIKPQHLSAQTKNRRLAQLNRLIEEDGAMRSRAPLLHQQYVGQYRSQEDGAAAAAAAAAPGQLPAVGRHPLSESVMAKLEEAQTRRKLTQQQAAEDEIEQESSDDDQWPEDRRAEMQQSIADPQLPRDQQESTCSDNASIEHCPRDLDQDTGRTSAQNIESSKESSGDIDHVHDIAAVARAAADSLKDPRGPRGEARTAALLLAHAGRDAPDTASSPEDDPHSQQAAAPSFIHIPVEEKVELQAEFLALMHQRYLAGEEEDVDYRAVDEDRSLDDDLADQIEQDAEDAYFDAD